MVEKGKKKSKGKADSPDSGPDPLARCLRDMILAGRLPEDPCEYGFTFLDALAYCDPTSAAAAVQLEERARAFEEHLRGCIPCSAWIGELREEENQEGRAMSSGRGYAPMPSSSGGVAPPSPVLLPPDSGGVAPPPAACSGRKPIPRPETRVPRGLSRLADAVASNWEKLCEQYSGCTVFCWLDEQEPANLRTALWKEGPASPAEGAFECQGREDVPCDAMCIYFPHPKEEEGNFFHAPRLSGR